MKKNKKKKDEKVQTDVKKERSENNFLGNAESVRSSAQNSNERECISPKSIFNESAPDSHEKFSYKKVLILVAFAIVLYWGLNHVSLIFHYIGVFFGLISPLLAGGAIAFVINTILVPIEKLWALCFGKIKNKTALKILQKLKRIVCLVLSTLFVFGIVCGLLFIVLPEIIITIKQFVDLIPSLFLKFETHIAEISEFLERYNIILPEINFNADKIIDFLNTLLSENGQRMIDATVGITASFFSSVFNSILSLVFAFYVLAQKEKLAQKLCTIIYAIIKKERADKLVKISTLSNNAFTKFITGQVIEAFIIGVLCFLGMKFFGMPYAAVVSVIIGTTALIPIFGAFIGAGLGAFLILSVDLMQAVWFIVFIIVLQQIESNIIYPRVVGQSIGLPGILVLTAVTVGGAMFGLVGIILGIPVCSVLYLIFNEFVSKRIEEKKSKNNS